MKMSSFTLIAVLSLLSLSAAELRDDSVIEHQRVSPHTGRVLQWDVMSHDEISVSQTLKERAAHIAAIASDFDGTFLNKSSLPSAENVRAFVGLRDQGYTVFPATGRNRAGILTATHEFNDVLQLEKHPGVYLNGLNVYGNGGELIYSHALPKWLVRDIILFARSVNCPVIFYSGGVTVTEEESEWVSWVTNRQNEPDVIPLKNLMRSVAGDDVEEEFKTIGERDAYTGELRVNKAMIVQVPSVDPAMRRKLEEDVIRGAADTAQAVPFLLEVMPKGNNKGQGVQLLLDHLHIDPSELMAIGDAENDLQMLKLAHIAVCPANASDRVKAESDLQVAHHNEHAFADAALKLFGYPPSKKSEVAEEEHPVSPVSRKSSSTLTEANAGGSQDNARRQKYTCSKCGHQSPEPAAVAA